MKISEPKSVVSTIGALEFAKKFRILGKDLYPISINMIRSLNHSCAWMPVLNMYNITCLRTSLRLRGASYRRYNATPISLNKDFHRHWFRHILIAYSPGGIRPLPFRIWLGFPEGFIPSPYLIGKVKWMLFEFLAPVEEQDP